MLPRVTDFSELADANGILNVSASDKTTGKSNKITITNVRKPVSTVSRIIGRGWRGLGPTFGTDH